MRRSAPALLLVLAAGIVGCGAPPGKITESPAATLAEGWVPAENKERGVSIGVAPGWKSPFAPKTMAPPTEPGGEQPSFSDEMQRAFENASIASAKGLEQEGIWMLAQGPGRGVAGEVPTRYVVRHQVLAGPMDLDNATKIVKNKMTLGKVQPSVDTPLGKAAALRADYADKMGDRVHEIVYVFVDGKDLYTLELTCTGDAGPIESVADAALKSLRITPAHSQ